MKTLTLSFISIGIILLFAYSSKENSLTSQSQNFDAKTNTLQNNTMKGELDFSENTIGEKPIAIKKWIGSKEGLQIDTAFENIKTIEINCRSCDEVTFNSHESSLINFKSFISRKDKGIVIYPDYNKFPAISYEIIGSVLQINFIDELAAFLIVGSRNCTSKFNFEVPKNIDLKVNNSDGNISIDGLDSRYCHLKTTSGKIVVKNTKTNLVLNSSDGKVYLDSIYGKVKLEVSSSDINIFTLKGNAEIESTYGKVVCNNIQGSINALGSSSKFNLSNIKGDITAKITDGNINFENFLGNVSIEASSGNITGKEVELTDKMYVKTNYGDIRINLKNDQNNLSYDLTCDYGTIKTKRNGMLKSEGNRLIIEKGKTKIIGISSSGSQVYE